MRRTLLASGTILVMLTGIFVAAPAEAAPASGGALTSGKSVKTKLAKAGRDVAYRFKASANRHVTFDITAFHLTSGGAAGGLYLRFYEPESTVEYRECYLSASSYCDFVTPVGGTWKLVVDGYGASKGSVTTTFRNDVATVALTSGTQVRTTLKSRGQNANYTFKATAGRHVTFDLTSFGLTSDGAVGGVYLRFYEPKASAEYQTCYFSSSSYCDFVTPVSGAWKVGVDGYSASTGSVTMTFRRDVATVALKPGVPVTTTIRSRGQNALYTFAATSGTALTFTISALDMANGGAGGGAYLRFYRPASSAEFSNCYFTAPTTCTLSPTASGAWKATLDGYSASIGTVTFSAA